MITSLCDLLYLVSFIIFYTVWLQIFLCETGIETHAMGFWAQIMSLQPSLILIVERVKLDHNLTDLYLLSIKAQKCQSKIPLK